MTNDNTQKAISHKQICTLTLPTNVKKVGFLIYKAKPAMNLLYKQTLLNSQLTKTFVKRDTLHE